jgi:uridine kinase
VGPVPVVHTDDLLDGWDDQLAFWPRLEEQVLTPLSQARPGRYRPYDWERGAFTGDEIEVPPAPVVIVEGVSAARERARALASLTVFVTAPSAMRLARALSRDGDAVRPYLLRWRRREKRHFAADATAHRVDLLVDSEDPAGYRFSHRNTASGP